MEINHNDALERWRRWNVWQRVGAVLVAPLAAAFTVFVVVATLGIPGRTIWAAVVAAHLATAGKTDVATIEDVLYLPGTVTKPLTVVTTYVRFRDATVPFRRMQPLGTRGEAITVRYLPEVPKIFVPYAAGTGYLDMIATLAATVVELSPWEAIAHLLLFGAFCASITHVLLKAYFTVGLPIMRARHWIVFPRRPQTL